MNDEKPTRVLFAVADPRGGEEHFFPEMFRGNAGKLPDYIEVDGTRYTPQAPACIGGSYPIDVLRMVLANADDPDALPAVLGTARRWLDKYDAGAFNTPQALPDVPEGWASWEDWLAEKGLTIERPSSCWRIFEDTEDRGRWWDSDFPTYPAALAAAIEHGKGVED